MTPTAALSASDRTACAVCADLLATGSQWRHASHLLVLTGVVGVAANVQHTGRPNLSITLLLLLTLLSLGLIQQYLGVRVSLDARLFDRLACGNITDLPALDVALQRLFSLPDTKIGRSLPERLAGAKRLYQGQAAATLLLAVTNLAIWWGLCP